MLSLLTTLLSGVLAGLPPRCSLSFNAETGSLMVRGCGVVAREATLVAVGVPACECEKKGMEKGGVCTFAWCGSCSSGSRGSSRSFMGLVGEFERETVNE